ncbi:MAG: hypothetical protein WDM92_00610 [Caulobacteraceae bacterium]
MVEVTKVRSIRGAWANLPSVAWENGAAWARAISQTPSAATQIIDVSFTSDSTATARTRPEL